MSVQQLTTTPVSCWVDCTVCLTGNALETRSPLAVCQGCFDSLGAYGRRQLLRQRNREAAEPK